MARLRTFNVRAEEGFLFDLRSAARIAAQLRIEDIVELSNDTEPHGRDVIIGEPPSRGRHRSVSYPILLVGRTPGMCP
jgi:hypothetical protein